MIGPHYLRTLATGIVLLAVPIVASAQSATDRLREAYQSGVQAFDRGKYADALPRFVEAARFVPEVFGPLGSREVTINNLRLIKRQADCLLELLRLAEATELYERCSRDALREEGTRSELYLQCQVNLGLIAWRLHQLDVAEERYQRVQALLPPGFERANLLANRAHVYLDKQQYPEATKLYQASSAECGVLPSSRETRLLEAANQHHLGMIAFRQGRYADAEQRFAFALARRREELPRDHFLTAYSMGMTASVYARLERDSDALQLFEGVLESIKTSRGDQHFDVGMELHELALLLDRRQRSHEAAERFTESRRIIRSYLQRQLTLLSPEEQAKFMAEERSRFTDAVAIALRRQQDPAFVAVAYEWVLNDKGLIQETVASQELLLRQAGDDSARQATLRQLNDLRRRIATASSGTFRFSEEEERRLFSEETRLQRELGIAPQNVAASHWTTTVQVLAALPTDATLIEFVRLDRDEPLKSQFEARPNGQPERERYLAFVVSHDRPTTLVDLGPATPIDLQVEKLRASIAEAEKLAPTGIPPESSVSLSAALETLGHLVWQPLQPHLGSRKSVILSPDGPLWLAPWCALPSRAGSTDVLLEHYRLSLVNSGRDLMQSKTDRPQSFTAIFANPDFDAYPAANRESLAAIFENRSPPSLRTALRSVSSRGGLPKVQSLPGTAVEAIAVKPSLQKLNGDAPPRMYTERFAQETVAKQLHRPRVVLFSTHGFFLPSRDPSETKAFRNPLLQCGLLLSGCNHAGEAAEGDDGILTGLEVCGIDLRGTELVVLSACETGIGRLNNGEGVAGLRQAFQLAGARSVVSTLWQVPDRDSALIMNDFFLNLAQGQTRPEALRAAQLKRLNARREKFGAGHPLYWAAWTLTGQ